MKVALTVTVTDEQRRALTGSKRLASRDEVRAFIEGTLGQLDAPKSIGATAHNPPARAPLVPSPDSYPPLLRQKLEVYKAKGWGEAELGMYVKGWYSPSSK